VILWWKIKGGSTGLFGGAIFVDGVDGVKKQVVRVCVEKLCVLLLLCESEALRGF
jgi:hypothetical protein